MQYKISLHTIQEIGPCGFQNMTYMKTIYKQMFDIFLLIDVLTNIIQSLSGLSFQALN